MDDDTKDVTATQTPEFAIRQPYRGLAYVLSLAFIVPAVWELVIKGRAAEPALVLSLTLLAVFCFRLARSRRKA